jgi:hypothetical protein
MPNKQKGGATHVAKKRAKRKKTENIIEEARRLLGKDQADVQFAVDAMRLARYSRPPHRYRIERLVYRGA